MEQRFGTHAPVTICQAHDDLLKAKLGEAGLLSYTSASGEEAVDRMWLWSAGDRCIANYDPFLLAYTDIVDSMIRVFGPRAYEPGAPECMLCYMNEAARNGCGDPLCEKKHDSGDDWVQYAVDDQLRLAEQLGLMGVPEAVLEEDR